MTTQKLTDRTALITPADGDLFYIHDVSDTSEDPGGTSKYITRLNLQNGFTFTVSQVSDFNAEVTANTDVAANTAARHTHANKALLDTYAQTEANLVDAVAKKHEHTNKAILDATTASFLAADETKLDGIEAGAEINTVDSVAGKTGAVALVKGDVGLGNVDNTSDASKPISTATQTALDGKANTAHTHDLDDITDAGTSAALDVAVTGNAAVGEVVKGNDTRLTDARTPTSHTHDISEVTSLQAALDGKVDENTAITGATKTKITYDAKGLVTAGADATTADIADSVDKRYITDAQQTVLGNTSGINTGDQTNITGNAGTVTTINGKISAGTNVTLDGTGTSGDPYVVNSSGGGGGTESPLILTASTATEVPLTLQGAASQTANLQEWQNSAGANLLRVEKDGRINSLITGGGQIAFSTSGGVQLYTGFANLPVLSLNGNWYGTSAGAAVGINFGANHGIAWGSAASGVSSGLSGDVSLRRDSVGKLKVTDGGAGAGSLMAKSAELTASTSTEVPLTVQGAVSQTANLQEWQNSAGTVLASVSETSGTGYITARRFAFSDDPSNRYITSAKWQSNLQIDIFSLSSVIISATNTQSGFIFKNEELSSKIWGTGSKDIMFRGFDTDAVTNRGVCSVTIRGGNANINGESITGQVIVGGNVQINGGNGASNATGDAHGGNTLIDGGVGYGTGRVGYILLGSVNAGNVGIGTTSPGAKLEIETGADATKGLIVQGTASQTANLTEWQNSAGTALSFIAADGNLTVPDEAYSSSWNGSLEVPTKNAVYDAIMPRVSSEASSATPTINTDNVNIHRITALAVDITSMTTNLSGTPTHGQKLLIEITGTAARAITWGASFEASTTALPTTTVSTDMLTVGFSYNSATSKWRCLASA